MPISHVEFYNVVMAYLYVNKLYYTYHEMAKLPCHFYWSKLLFSSSCAYQSLGCHISKGPATGCDEMWHF